MRSAHGFPGWPKLIKARVGRNFIEEIVDEQDERLGRQQNSHFSGSSEGAAKPGERPFWDLPLNWLASEKVLGVIWPRLEGADRQSENG